MKFLKVVVIIFQLVLMSQQIEIIFFKVFEFYEIYKEFYDGFFFCVQQWSYQQWVGDFFQKLVSQLGVYWVFVDNYGVVMEMVEKCCQVNVQFVEIFENLRVRSNKDVKDLMIKNFLEILFYKFVDCVMRSMLVFYDLLKYIFVSYFDYFLLQDVFCILQNFLFSINEEIIF